MSPDFDELVGSDLAPGDRERLRRAHDLLVAAGPAPELPPALAHPGAPDAEVTPFFTRRRHTTIAALAAALALATFVGGYAWGHAKGGLATDFTVAMHGTQAAPGARASLLLAPKDKAGNWPMLLKVANLRTLPEGQLYQLWLTRKGRPAALCGTFVVSGVRTDVYLNAPFKLKQFDGWIVREGQAGPVVLTT